MQFQNVNKWTLINCDVLWAHFMLWCCIKNISSTIYRIRTVYQAFVKIHSSALIFYRRYIFLQYWIIIVVWSKENYNNHHAAFMEIGRCWSIPPHFTFLSWVFLDFFSLLLYTGCKKFTCGLKEHVKFGRWNKCFI